MSQVVKVFTPIKRVPTMIGKSQSGQKLPFGPYTLPQVAGGATLLLISAVCAMTFPINPAITFIIGVAFTVATVFGLGLVPYTGVRLSSRVWWVGRLLVHRKPVSASGMPVDPASVRHTLFVEQTVAIILPDPVAGSGPAPQPLPIAVGLLELPALATTPASPTNGHRAAPWGDL